MQREFTTSSTLSRWEQMKFWEELCEGLFIEKEIFVVSETRKIKTVVCQEDEEPTTSRKYALQQQGFAEINDQRFDQSLCSIVAKGINDLKDAGYPATFILLFDDTWKIAAFAKEKLTKLTSPDHKFQYDALAWYVTGAGFSPHRDRQPENAANTFDKDGNPALVTHWIALTDATPATSCLYVIPKPHDPGYITGDIASKDPLERALSGSTANYQRIRAIPRAAGESIVFTHRIIHWGSARDEGAPASLPPRIALSFTAARTQFEEPYLAESVSFPPPFQARLFLVCCQMICYYQRFELPAPCLEACYTYCCQHQEFASTSYWQRVQREYNKARHENDPSNSDAEEALMDAMLDEPDEFEDDFEEQHLVEGNGGDEGVSSHGEDEEVGSDEEEISSQLRVAKRKRHS